MKLKSLWSLPSAIFFNFCTYLTFIEQPIENSVNLVVLSACYPMTTWSWAPLLLNKYYLTALFIVLNDAAGFLILCRYRSYISSSDIRGEVGPPENDNIMVKDLNRWWIKNYLTPTFLNREQTITFDCNNTRHSCALC